MDTMADNLWEVVHAYRRAVRRDLGLPIRCPEDSQELVPVVHYDDEPALKCLVCHTVYTIGLDMIDQMKSVIDGGKE